MARLPSTMTVSDVCMQAWTIGQNDGWCQGRYRIGSTRCLVAMLNDAMNHPVGADLPDEVVQTLHTHLMETSEAYGALVLHEQASHIAGMSKKNSAEWRPSNFILIRWNDRVGRTADEVLGMLKTIGMSDPSAVPRMDEEEKYDFEEDDVPAPVKPEPQPKAVLVSV